MRRFFSILFLFFGIILLSQEITVQKELLRKAQKNHEMILKNSEKSFAEAKKIEKEAQKSGAKEAELLAINTQCIYFKINNDVENAKSASERLSEKAGEYGNYTYQVFSTVWISDYYVYNKLYDQALAQLEKGSRIVKRTDERDSLAIRARSNLYLAYCNYYLVKKDYKNQLKYAKLSIKEYEKYPDKKIRDKQLFLDYSNLAAAYFDINADSAKYYAELSLSKDSLKNRSDVRFNNFLILGMVEMGKNNPEKALDYFLESEKNTSIHNNFTVPDLYENIIVAYKKLGKNEEADKYIQKRDSLKLQIAETRNDSLYKTLEEEKKKKAGNARYLYLSGIVLAVAVTVVLIMYYHKKRQMQQYFSKFPKSENYTELMKMLKENDPAFVPYFNELFPDFNAKLLKINPKLLPSDLEFCALLKLKIPTDKIAQHKNITTKSVQNKKHYIRKKLNIPTEVDIYTWFYDL